MCTGGLCELSYCHELTYFERPLKDLVVNEHAFSICILIDLKGHPHSMQLLKTVNHRAASLANILNALSCKHYYNLFH